MKNPSMSNVSWSSMRVGTFGTNSSWARSSGSDMCVTAEATSDSSGLRWGNICYMNLLQRSLAMFVR